MTRALAQDSAPALALAVAALLGLTAADEPRPLDTQAETIRLTTAAEALEALGLPEGFRATLFAAEPDVRQPIGLATDARGRLWVAENDTYAESASRFDPARRDRILILEDVDGDGRADRRTVFWDGAERLTSVEPGLGGVWALCPPVLVFLPDRDGDDRPDGPPEVVLDGFNYEDVQHNIANGLRWGPDGWLYGRHGILATSHVGPPGTPPAARVDVNCAIWRYHPTRKIFEVVCRGTTNPWGLDWDEHGEPFFINTVIGHLWHAVPGAHFQRMYGEDFNPYLYELIGQVADHYHWDISAEAWSDIRQAGVTPNTDRAGGGHAHSGLMIYLGENWPEPYRGDVFTVNLHGRRLNRDVLRRRGAGYVAHHGQDLLKSSDPWYRAVELIYGPDGGVYLADWSDIGECHEADGVHRSSGRIFKITAGEPRRPPYPDLAALDEVTLVDLQRGRNEWLVRQARGVLRDRAAAGKAMAETHAALRETLATDPDALQRLRALWALYVTGGTTEEMLRDRLDDGDEHERSWAVRLLVDAGAPSAAIRGRFAERAGSDPSGLVLLYLASALQRLPLADRWPIAERLAARSEFADDPAFPLMVWYGIEPAVPDDPGRAVALAGASELPIVARHVARRLTADLDRAPAPVAALVGRLAEADDARRLAILDGMAAALRGRRKAPAPAGWEEAQARLDASTAPAVRRRARELSVVFGDGRAVEELAGLAATSGADLQARRDALRVLVEARAEGAKALLLGLLADRDLAADAARGLAAFDDPDLGRVLLDAFPRLGGPARAAAVATLAARPATALDLLEAIANGAVGRAEVSPFLVRQMLDAPDAELRRRASALWPELKAIPAAKKARIEALRPALAPEALAAADPSRGRQVFERSCASCHTLFGQGGKIGPDLTGGQRADLAYLLENIVDPAATVGADYRMSTVALADGRVLNGILGDRSGPTLAIQTPEERLLVPREEVEAIRDSDLSLMPDGLLDVLKPEEIRDLFAYLMGPAQVPPPAGLSGAQTRDVAEDPGAPPGF